MNFKVFTRLRDGSEHEATIDTKTAVDAGVALVDCVRADRGADLDILELVVMRDEDDIVRELQEKDDTSEYRVTAMTVAQLYARLGEQIAAGHGEGDVFVNLYCNADPIAEAISGAMDWTPADLDWVPPEEDGFAGHLCIGARPENPRKI